MPIKKDLRTGSHALLACFTPARCHFWLLLFFYPTSLLMTRDPRKSEKATKGGIRFHYLQTFYNPSISY
ncbi:Uncharacterized protein HZ326_9848 [Fusarium oxysporum f. sp. albedinis]|nr:Uncharacterized protein HZ326_9848 [Fusarium oxysporum f. sp. albedinis]